MAEWAPASRRSMSERSHQLAERIIRAALRRVDAGELFVNVRIVRTEPEGLSQRLDGACRIALDLRKPRNADDGHVPSGERPRERGPLFFTPRDFVSFGGVVSRRLAWPSERRHGVVVLVRGEQRETGGDRAAGDGRRAQQAVRDRVERGKRRGPGSRGVEPEALIRVRQQRAGTRALRHAACIQPLRHVVRLDGIAGVQMPGVQKRLAGLRRPAGGLERQRSEHLHVGRGRPERGGRIEFAQRVTHAATDAIGHAELHVQPVCPVIRRAGALAADAGLRGR